MDRYEKRALRPLQAMERRLAQLDGRLEALEKSDDPSQRLREQDRALGDLKKIARDARKVARLEEKSEKRWTPTAGAGMLGGQAVVASVKRELDSLDGRLARLGEPDAALPGQAEQSRALGEIKEILREAGLYRQHRPPPADGRLFRAVPPG